MELEELRYNDKLSIQFDVTGETSKTKIAPLLILPVVENCFKHGISEQTDKSWIKISLDLRHRTQDMFLKSRNVRFEWEHWSVQPQILAHPLIHNRFCF